MPTMVQALRAGTTGAVAAAGSVAASTSTTNPIQLVALAARVVARPNAMTAPQPVVSPPVRTTRHRAPGASLAPAVAGPDENAAGPGPRSRACGPIGPIRQNS
ncbi:hypothetical protein GCM10009788_53130 [Nocardioides humi]|uniref:Secreted protein n=1 Tax=Nocardioides humi TaxID=449461 RepID=A0ABN2BPG0_9ACTN